MNLKNSIKIIVDDNIVIFCNTPEAYLDNLNEEGVCLHLNVPINDYTEIRFIRNYKLFGWKKVLDYYSEKYPLEDNIEEE